jgi:hypothetical protein
VEPAVEAARVPAGPAQAVVQMAVPADALMADRAVAPVAVQMVVQMAVPAVARAVEVTAALGTIGRVATTGTSRTDHR